MALLTEGLAAAAAPVKGGFIREALISQYPRLAALLEETFRRIVQDTDVSPTLPIVPFASVSASTSSLC